MRSRSFYYMAAVLPSSARCTLARVCESKAEERAARPDRTRDISQFDSRANPTDRGKTPLVGTGFAARGLFLDNTAALFIGSCSPRLPMRLTACSSRVLRSVRFRRAASGKRCATALPGENSKLNPAWKRVPAKSRLSLSLFLPPAENDTVSLRPPLPRSLPFSRSMGNRVIGLSRSSVPVRR